MVPTTLATLVFAVGLAPRPPALPPEDDGAARQPAPAAMADATATATPSSEPARAAPTEPAAGPEEKPAAAGAEEKAAALVPPAPGGDRPVVQRPRRKSKKKRRRRRALPKGHPDCGGRVPIHEHVVQAGEHLGLIAGKYGVRRADLVALNKDLRDPDLIHPGQRVRVCPEILPRVHTRIDYVVQPGDNLAKIAASYQMTLEELLEMQGESLPDPNRILVGQKLEIWIDGPVLPAFRPFDRDFDGEMLAGGVRLPPGAHYHVKRPHLAWGTPRTVRLIQRSVERYHRRRPGGPKIFIGDISKKGGGRLAPHLSHRSGKDVDVGYVRRGSNAHNPTFTGVSSRTLDVPRSWELIKSFLDTGEVRYVFVDYRLQKKLYEYARSQGMPRAELDEIFQYPRGRRRAHGIIRHWPSHKHHFHVRFR